MKWNDLHAKFGATSLNDMIHIGKLIYMVKNKMRLKPYLFLKLLETLNQDQSKLLKELENGPN